MFNLAAKYAEDYMKGYLCSSTLVVVENHLEETVYLRWGHHTGGSWGYGASLPLDPNHVVSRKVEHGNPKFFRKYPCVQVSQDENHLMNNATIILIEPSELCHTKVFEVRDDGIHESINPSRRNWHDGEMPCYQD
jgi:hypothetical protein